jgi:hypothetical protein
MTVCFDGGVATGPVTSLLSRFQMENGTFGFSSPGSAHGEGPFVLDVLFCFISFSLQRRLLAKETRVFL